MHEYAGNLHIHSIYSDGSGTVEEIAAAAARAGLDFIVITDHFNLDALDNKQEGYHKEVLVLAGMEINESCNHYLAFNIDRVIANDEDNTQRIIDEVKRQKGFGVIAHPDEKGSPLYKEGEVFNWVDWSVQGFQGIEIWNYLSQFRDAAQNLLRGIFIMFNSHAAFTGPCSTTIKRLDQLQKNGVKIFAFAGSDAHGIKINFGPLAFCISSYYDCFRCINMHVLTEEKLSGVLEKDKQLIYDALERGSSWIAYDYFKNSRGFKFHFRSGQKEFHIGNSISWQKDLTAYVKTPYPARTILIKNGEEYRSSYGREHFFRELGPGVYRIEAYHRHRCTYRPWIFSNPIWVI